MTVLSNILSSAFKSPYAAAPTSLSINTSCRDLVSRTSRYGGASASAYQGSLPAIAQALAGALPAYHPHFLAALLAKGRLGEACGLLRRLLIWLQCATEALEHSDGYADVALEDQQVQGGM